MVGKDADEQLIRLCEFFGTKGLYKFIKKQGIEVEPKVMDVIYANLDKRPVWESLLTVSNLKFFDVKGVDLLERLLSMDPVRLLG